MTNEAEVNVILKAMIEVAKKEITNQSSNVKDANEVVFWLNQLDACAVKGDITHMQYVLMGLDAAKILEQLKKMAASRKNLFDLLMAIVNFAAYALTNIPK